MRLWSYWRSWWVQPATDTKPRKTTAGDLTESSVRGLVVSFLFIVLLWLADHALDLPLSENTRNWVAAVAGALVALIQVRRRYHQDWPSLSTPARSSASTQDHDDDV